MLQKSCVSQAHFQGSLGKNGKLDSFLKNVNAEKTER